MRWPTEERVKIPDSSNWNWRRELLIGSTIFLLALLAMSVAIVLGARHWIPR